MPRLPRDAHEEELQVAETIHKGILQIMGVPQFFAGVGRKANVGNFETIDVYSAVAIPMGVTVGELNEGSLRQIAAEAATIGFEITSAETFSRYSMIKSMQNGDK